MIFGTRKPEAPPARVFSREQLIDIYMREIGNTRPEIEYILDHPEDYQSAVRYVSLKRKLHEKQRAFKRARQAIASGRR
jgi:hypothetical protein